MMPSSSLRLIALSAILLLACASAARNPLEPLPAGGIHVLFIGNSLTYTNDLPGTVAALGALSGDTIRVAMAAGPDLALIDHTAPGSDAQRAIQLGGWNFVVLQQGPTTAGICRDTLVRAATLLKPAIDATGARMALLETWPGASYASLFDEVRVSYQAAARATNGVFIPAGEAWRSALQQQATADVYGPDGYHPSELGTFLTALVVYERVSGHDARSLPAVAKAGGHTLNLAPAIIRQLQQIAHDANTQFGPMSAPSAEELSRPSQFHGGTGC